MLTYLKLTVRAIWNNFSVRRAYLRNGSRHQQLERNLIDCHLLSVAEKIDKFLFTKKKVIDADVDLPKFKI